MQMEDVHYAEDVRKRLLRASIFKIPQLFAESDIENMVRTSRDLAAFKSQQTVISMASKGGFSPYSRSRSPRRSPRSYRRRSPSPGSRSPKKVRFSDQSPSRMSPTKSVNQ